MKKYNVVFAYSIQVEADNEKDAEEQAAEIYIDTAPKLKEMGIEVEEINSLK